jgi:ABC-type nitrate/sulfonate/bicarbonate transport system ATPase subunit
MPPAYSYGNTLLSIKNVSLSFGSNLVLKNLSAEIKDILRPGIVTGQVVGFLGPSGIGKSQLFRIIAGLNHPDSGEVDLNGLNRPVRAGEVGVVSQAYTLFWHRTVWSNLMLAARQKVKTDAEAKDKILEFMSLFGLEGKALLYPAELSGGQRQRAAIIQQLLCSEHFLLMDEPFSGLDLIVLEKVCATISKVANLDELNTVIVVTHDVTSACSVADHIWLMGRDRGPDGQPIPGAYIKKTYDLIERDLCWHPELTLSPQFTDFVREVKQEFRGL